MLARVHVHAYALCSVAGPYARGPMPRRNCPSFFVVVKLGEILVNLRGMFNENATIFALATLAKTLLQFFSRRVALRNFFNVDIVKQQREDP